MERLPDTTEIGKVDRVETVLEGQVLFCPATHARRRSIVTLGNPADVEHATAELIEKRCENTVRPGSVRFLKLDADLACVTSDSGECRVTNAGELVEESARGYLPPGFLADAVAIRAVIDVRAPRFTVLARQGIHPWLYGFRFEFPRKRIDGNGQVSVESVRYEELKVQGNLLVSP